MASSVALASGSAVGGSKAPNPRPSPCRLFMAKHLLGEIQIRNGSWRTYVVEHDGLSIARCFRDANVSRDDGRQDLISQVLLHFALDLTSKARAPIEHREHN